MTVYVILGPGTSECEAATGPIEPVGMTQYLTNGLPDQIAGHQVERFAIGYTAGYGDKASYLNSVNDLKVKLVSAIQQTPDSPSTLIFLVGYSQGATGCGDIARDILNGQFKIGSRRFLQYYGVADPRRSRSDHFVGPMVKGEGITGQRPSRKDTKMYFSQFCAPGDIIASNEREETLFEYIVPITTQFWVGDTIQWVAYTGALLGSAAMQQEFKKDFRGLSGYIEFKRRLRYTLELTAKYIASGVHTSYVQYKINGGATVGDYIVKNIKDRVEGVSK